ncbi:hypothetical protein XENOCAPTIV_010271 [Xenoophorus captivus]|uniref:Uncharacterized protein n=1 Tax=Xenoophorus captivus TaxID=1517983 RepID=A0ABV0R181_9TELE
MPSLSELNYKVIICITISITQDFTHPVKDTEVQKVLFWEKPDAPSHSHPKQKAPLRLPLLVMLCSVQYFYDVFWVVMFHLLVMGVLGRACGKEIPLGYNKV